MFLSAFSKAFKALTQSQTQDEKAAANLLRLMNKQLSGQALTEKNIALFNDSLSFLSYRGKQEALSPELMETTLRFLTSGDGRHFPSLVYLAMRTIPPTEEAQKEFFRKVLEGCELQHKVLHSQRKQRWTDERINDLEEKEFGSSTPLAEEENDPLAPVIDKWENIVAVTGLVMRNGPAFATWAVHEILNLRTKDIQIEPLITPVFHAALPYLESDACPDALRKKTVEETLQTMNYLAREAKGDTRYVDRDLPLPPALTTLGGYLMEILRPYPAEYDALIERLLTPMDLYSLAMHLPIDRDQNDETIFWKHETWVKDGIASLAPLRARMPDGDIVLIDRLLPTDERPVMIYSKLGGEVFRVFDETQKPLDDLSEQDYRENASDDPDQTAARTKLLAEAKALFLKADTLEPALPKIKAMLARPLLTTQTSPAPQTKPHPEP